MVFPSVPFLFYFLPLVLGAYYAVPAGRRAARNAVLLGASLVFYAWGEGAFVLLLLASVAGNHLIAPLAARSGGWLAAGVAGNLALLGVFKYAGFAAEAVGAEGFNGPHLPLGISFFTFQAISYLIDVRRGAAAPSARLLNTGLYIASFPQLIAGPIVRYQTVAEQLRHRTEGVSAFADGVRLFVLGLGQKVLLANLAAGPADTVFALPPDQIGFLLAWAGAAAYTLQIFFDFAGYSNMAMGLGLMFGFTFPRNFDFPYVSGSVTEFWRRWHITLSRWFRDYLYIPLGGNRHGRARTAANLWIVFLLCGLWHGAAWTFVAWGAWHGLLLTVERFGLGTVLARVPPPIRQGYVLLVVGLGWVLFRSETLAQAGGYYAAMLGLTDGGASLRAAFPGAVPYWLVIACLFATPWPKQAAGRAAAWLSLTAPVGLGARGGAVAVPAGLTLLLVACLAFVAGGAYNPFIYFRF